jgi:ABC-type amino acid transport substrate-binding protein
VCSARSTPTNLSIARKRPAGCDALLKAFVDNWIKQARDNGRFAKIYAGWFE